MRGWQGQLSCFHALRAGSSAPPITTTGPALVCCPGGLLGLFSFVRQLKWGRASLTPVTLGPVLSLATGSKGQSREDISPSPTPLHGRQGGGVSSVALLPSGLGFPASLTTGSALVHSLDGEQRLLSDELQPVRSGLALPLCGPGASSLNPCHHMADGEGGRLGSALLLSRAGSRVPSHRVSSSALPR